MEDIAQDVIEITKETYSEEENEEESKSINNKKEQNFILLNLNLKS